MAAVDLMNGVTNGPNPSNNVPDRIEDDAGHVLLDNDALHAEIARRAALEAGPGRTKQGWGR